MGLFLGIDFGTSTNVVTRWDTARKCVVPIPIGAYGSGAVFPNVIYYESTDKGINTIVGDDAVQKGKPDPDNAVFAIKRSLENSNFRKYIPALGRNIGNEEVAADIFSWIKKNVEKARGGETVDGVVISVPFAFQNPERRRIENAARRAGLQVLGLIEEPVAAALSFGIMDKTERGKAEKILVFDLGGGTFDVTIFDFQKHSNDNFYIRVLTTSGDKNLGGIDIDDMIVDKISLMMQDEFSDYHLDRQPEEVQKTDIGKMRQKAVELKEALSSDDEADIFFSGYLGDSCRLDKFISVEDFDKWLQVFLTKIESVLDDALLDADLDIDDIDRVIMVGGTSNIPAINEKVSDYFGKEPEKTDSLTLMVGEGAGIYCGLKYVEKSLNFDIAVGVSQTIGIKWQGRFMEMLPRNTLYGESSKPKFISLSDGAKRISIDVVQGNIMQNYKIGNISVGDDLRQKLINGKLGIRLNTDANTGTVGYELYSVVSNNGKSQLDKLLFTGKAGEE